MNLRKFARLLCPDANEWNTIHVGVGTWNKTSKWVMSSEEVGSVDYQSHDRHQLRRKSPHVFVKAAKLPVLCGWTEPRLDLEPAKTRSRINPQCSSNKGATIDLAHGPDWKTLSKARQMRGGPQCLWCAQTAVFALMVAPPNKKNT